MVRKSLSSGRGTVFHDFGGISHGQARVSVSRSYGWVTRSAASRLLALALLSCTYDTYYVLVYSAGTLNVEGCCCRKTEYDTGYLPTFSYSSTWYIIRSRRAGPGCILNRGWGCSTLKFSITAFEFHILRTRNLSLPFLFLFFLHTYRVLSAVVLVLLDVMYWIFQRV